MIYSLLRKAYSICFGLSLILTMIEALQAQSYDRLYPDIEGWKRSDSIRVYTPASLYTFIDGAADAFLMEDFELLTVAYYTRGDTSVTVEIYTHRTEQNAYGIYSQERSSSVEYLPIGIQGYYDETILNFVIGRTYVKLTSFTLGSKEKECLRSIAEAVEKRIGGTTSPPRMFSCFPKRGLIPNSECFIGKDFLGYSYFHSAYYADYQIDSTSFQLFVIVLDNADEGKSAWTEYLKSLGLPLNVRVSGMVTFNDPYHGAISIEFRGNIIDGIIGHAPQEFLSSDLNAFHDCIRNISN